MYRGGGVTYQVEDLVVGAQVGGRRIGGSATKCARGLAGRLPGSISSSIFLVRPISSSYLFYSPFLSKGLFTYDVREQNGKGEGWQMLTSSAIYDFC